ncbi:hypothetical protein AVEN_29145-1 [Araneus ventricosus]|uniref:Mos1 transposase HTH domain-containing protein n=1 Tax=Araneus ventricosus TaxID=182803 RepID=A0A4Y2AKC0_ARAVE|nr:hypothetical protein AVEN_29145-1 [Araneus ventricosus]
MKDRSATISFLYTEEMFQQDEDVYVGEYPYEGGVRGEGNQSIQAVTRPCGDLSTEQAPNTSFISLMKSLEFCQGCGKTATETQEMLVKVYGVEAVNKKCVFEWFKRFRDGKEDVEDEPRSGLPPTSTTPDNCCEV